MQVTAFFQSSGISPNLCGGTSQRLWSAASQRHQPALLTPLSRAHRFVGVELLYSLCNKSSFIDGGSVLASNWIFFPKAWGPVMLVKTKVKKMPFHCCWLIHFWCLTAGQCFPSVRAHSWCTWRTLSCSFLTSLDNFNLSSAIAFLTVSAHTGNAPVQSFVNKEIFKNLLFHRLGFWADVLFIGVPWMCLYMLLERVVCVLSLNMHVHFCICMCVIREVRFYDTVTRKK